MFVWFGIYILHRPNQTVSQLVLSLFSFYPESLLLLIILELFKDHPTCFSTKACTHQAAYPAMTTLLPEGHFANPDCPRDDIQHGGFPRSVPAIENSDGRKLDAVELFLGQNPVGIDVFVTLPKNKRIQIHGYSFTRILSIIPYSLAWPAVIQ